MLKFWTECLVKKKKQPKNNTFYNSYDMKVATKEWSLAEKIFRLTWESNPVLAVKNPVL